MLEGKKIILIDGESLLFMRWLLGIDKILFRALATLLRSAGQCTALAERPLCTLNSNRHSGGLQREIQRAGFLLKPAASFREEDDLIIKKAIIGCKHRPDITEVILVSCDGAIIDTLTWLRTTVPHIQSAIVVATLAHDPKNDQCAIRRDIAHMLQCNVLGFIELNRYVEHIGSKARA